VAADRERARGAKAPLHIETDRLVLRPPAADDAQRIYAGYAADAQVTRYVGFPRHRSLEDTRAFIAWSDAEWARWPAGPYLAERRDAGGLVGGTGLAFDAPDRARTGYVLARAAWGAGFATEALAAMVRIAAQVGVRRLEALCHPEHRASARVLEKCGFVLEGVRPDGTEFPNLLPGVLSAALCYVRRPG
jgi:[ribosomal protein S5]-alanine N-acetyltransferase